MLHLLNYELLKTSTAPRIKFRWIERFCDWFYGLIWNMQVKIEGTVHNKGLNIPLFESKTKSLLSHTVCQLPLISSFSAFEKIPKQTYSTFLLLDLWAISNFIVHKRPLASQKSCRFPAELRFLSFVIRSTCGEWRWRCWRCLYTSNLISKVRGCACCFLLSSFNCMLWTEVFCISKENLIGHGRLS